VPSFCRHNHLVSNCPICSREQSVAMRPIVTSGAPKVSAPRPAGGAGRGETGRGGPARAGGGAGRSRPGGGLKVRRLARGVDDGYHSALVPGIRSSADADRLAVELAYAAERLGVLETSPPGLFAEVADATGDLEERTWLAFLIAYLGPLEGEGDPFASVQAARTSWASGELPGLDGVAVGPRGAHDLGRGVATLEAYRAWAGRAGSQAAAFGGEESWTPERRFARAFERMAFPGMHRDARYDLLVTLGRTGVYELRGGALFFGGENETTVAAKRALGIGDPMLLERRAAELAEACAVPLEALDLGLGNWGTGERLYAGLPAAFEPDGLVADRARAALGL
jgi:hypothetical protein